MEQDGKFEQPTGADASNHASTTSTSGGKVLLTLCTLPEDASPYRHATIRFPSSYQEACAAALKVFTAYIPSDVEAVSLRQVVHQTDGQKLWSIIPEDDWDVALERRGEEVGVFLPNVIPETIPHRKEAKAQPPKKLVLLRFFESGKHLHLLRAVNSLENCIAVCKALPLRDAWPDYVLYYDERMVGTEADQRFYRNRVADLDRRPKWRVLHDPDVFGLLLDLFPDPMWIFIEKPSIVAKGSW